MSVQGHRQFALCQEMLESGQIISNLNVKAIQKIARNLTKKDFFLTGEGSSRIFPAKKILFDAWIHHYQGRIQTEAATQAIEYDLQQCNVFVASNSGKTKEGVRLIRSLKERQHDSIVGIVANDGTPIQSESDAHYLLSCGKERAVAATKSVIEQALFYDILFRELNGKPLPDLLQLGDLVTEVATAEVPEEIVALLSDAPVLYWAGRNNGVAEELTLKTNEITRKKSDYLEGTYAAHGVEEVMTAQEAMVWIQPFESEEAKFSEALVGGVGLPIVAIADRKTSFPTFKIPNLGDFTPYLELVAGWNLMVEIGIRLGVDLDKPERARKVGNEFLG